MRMAWGGVGFPQKAMLSADVFGCFKKGIDLNLNISLAQLLSGFSSAGNRSIQRSPSSMWESAETMRVPAGQSRVFAWGLRSAATG